MNPIKFSDLDCTVYTEGNKSKAMLRGVFYACKASFLMLDQ